MLWTSEQCVNLPRSWIRNACFRSESINRRNDWAAAHALSGIVDITKPGAPVLPPFKYVAEVSLKVATAVAKKHKNKV